MTHLEPANTADEDERSRTHDPIYRKIAWRLTPFLFVCYIIAYLDRVNVGIAKLQMLHDLGFSDAVYAFGASVLFWGLILFEVPSNMIMARVGARAWISRIMISWGVISMAVAYTAEIASLLGVDRATTFYVLRFLLGVCEAGFFPGIVFYLSYWFPSHRQTQVVAGFMMALPVSFVVGTPLSGWIMDTFNGWAGLEGWRWMTLVEGFPAVLLGLGVLAWLKSSPEQVRWLSAAEKSVVSSNLEMESGQKEHNLLPAMKDPRVWLMCLVYLSFGTGFFGLSFWLPTIIHMAGVNRNFDIGLLTAIPYLAACVAMTLIAKRSRTKGERRFHMVIPAFVSGLGFIASAVFSNMLPLVIIFMSIAISGIMCVMSLFWTLPSGFLSGRAAAAGIALIYSIGNFSGMFGAYVSHLAMSWTGDIKNGTYVFAAFMFLAGFLVLFAPKSVLNRKGQNLVDIADASNTPSFSRAHDTI